MTETRAKEKYPLVFRFGIDKSNTPALIIGYAKVDEWITLTENRVKELEAVLQHLKAWRLEK